MLGQSGRLVPDLHVGWLFDRIRGQRRWLNFVCTSVSLIHIRAAPSAICRWRVLEWVHPSQPHVRLAVSAVEPRVSNTQPRSFMAKANDLCMLPRRPPLTAQLRFVTCRWRPPSAGRRRTQRKQCTNPAGGSSYVGSDKYRAALNTVPLPPDPRGETQDDTSRSGGPTSLPSVSSHGAIEGGGGGVVFVFFWWSLVNVETAARQDGGRTPGARCPAGRYPRAGSVKAMRTTTARARGAKLSTRSGRWSTENGLSSKEPVSEELLQP